MYLILLNCMLKMSKMVNFTLHLFCYNFKKESNYPTKLNISLPQDLAISLQGIYSKDMKTCDKNVHC